MKLQIWVSDNTTELMPMWCPPTPPQQDGDLYVDHAMAFLYDTAAVMGEADLPPAYVRREAKRSAAAARQQHEPPEGRRPPKVARREEPPRSLFHSPGALKVRRDLKMQKYRGLARPPPGAPKQPAEQPLFHEWTVHEDMALLKAVQGLQGLPLSLAGGSPGHTANWDFVSDYVNTVSITYRSPKQCRQRYESHLTLREEGKPPSLEGYLRKKKSRAAGGGAPPKHPSPGRAAGRPARTAQLYAQDNNAAFSRLMCERFECLRAIAGRKAAQARSVAHNPLINKAKSSPASSECGIDLEHPVLPVEVAARRAERLAREKKSLTSEQKQFAARLHLMKGIIANQQQAHQAAAGPSAASGGGVAAAATAAAASTSCQVVTQAAGVVSAAGAATGAAAAPGTPPNALRTQRIIASPIQPTTMVSVSGLSPAQLQAATQRLIVSAAASGAALQAKTSAAATVAAAGKAISQSQFAMLRQANLKQQLRLKTSTVTIGGQQAVVQLAQAQPRAQLVAGGGRRTVTESEMAQLLKKQQQLQQQQKLLAAAAASGAAVQGLSPQVLAQAMQAGGSGATLVKTVVSSAGVTQTVSIPVTGVSLGTPGKTLTPTLKAGNASQLRQLQLQQQLLAQKKLGAQKLGVAAAQAAASKGGAQQQQQAQLIVGAKPLQTAMTVQQFQQVIRSPMGVSQGPVVLAKAAQRVIPVNTSQGGKQTIQVVAATSQLNTALRPQSTSTLAGALAGLKAQGGQQPTLLSQVSAALGQGVGVRQGSPVRIQTSNGTPMVAVSVQQQQQGASPQSSSGSSSSSDHVSRFLKK